MPTINRLTGRVANEVQTNGLRYESPGSQVIPDSEEERQRQRGGAKLDTKVILISSEESDNEDCTSITMSPTKPSVGLPGPSNHPNPKKYKPSRRIFLSSDDDSEVEIIEATSEKIIERTRATDTTFKYKAVSRDDEGPIQVTDNDDAIIVFDEPKGAARPYKKEGNKTLLPRRTRAIFEEIDIPSRSSATPVACPSTPVSTPGRIGGKLATPRTRNERAKAIEKATMLQAYAEELFIDLNKTVFKGRLPDSTKLNWNKRLLKTAGRAKYHRSRDGIQTVEIELAQKILDCEERIRNTLSHEMCHLATWIIDNKIDEHHGRLFKKWANLVMQTHPEIDVSVRHDYEISYPFEWKCEKCAKIYGRFSKSIRPDECVCGVCKEGSLIPLFGSKRTKNASKTSKFAASNPQDSPRTVPSGTRSELERTDTDAEDSAVEILASALAGTSITL